MRCAIFCNVIDNFGDIGICWRLARQLAHDYQLTVTLFVNDLSSFAMLAPQLQSDTDLQQLGLITVQHWTAQITFDQPFDLIIEGFGCRLSDQLIGQMAQQAAMGQPPLWINLEYLSAEDWAVDCHAMHSIHAATGLRQTFWFPGVVEQSGGLIREHDLIRQRQQFQQDLTQQALFLQQLNLPQAMQFSRTMSLFSYANAAISDLLTALANDTESTLLLVPHSKSIPDIAAWLQSLPIAQVTLQVGEQINYQNLTIAVLPFLSQPHYDQLLWACNLNFVRGEDSCVRSQWAGRPFIWHIYPQDEQVHLIKLSAWINQVENKAGKLASWHLAMQAWNAAAPSSPMVWQQFLKALPEWTVQATTWSNHLSAQPDLATRLMNWVQQQMER